MATPGAGGRARRHTRHVQGHGAAGHDEVLQAGPALARVEVGMPLGLPKSSAKDHSCGLQLSTSCGDCGESVSQPVTT